MQTIKRHLAGTTNAEGTKTGGQFKAQERAKEKILTCHSSAQFSPYPTKKRRSNIKLRLAQTDTRPISKTPIVAIMKDSKTGLWHAQTPYASSSMFQERINGGLQGSEEEIAGWTAKTICDLANRGDIDIGNEDHTAQASVGVAVAGAMLGLPGWWSNFSTRYKASSSANYFADRAQTSHRKSNLYVYTPEARISKHAREHLKSRICYLLAGFKVNGAERILSDKDYRSNFFWPTRSLSNYPNHPGILLRAISSQHAIQNFMRIAKENDVQGLRELTIAIESQGTEEDQNNTPVRYIADSMISEMALKALAGVYRFPDAGHDSQAFKRFLDTSESEHTSHIFEPSMNAVAEYDDSIRHPADEYNVGVTIPGQFPKDTKTTQLVSKKSSQTLLGDIALGRQTASSEANANFVPADMMYATAKFAYNLHTERIIEGSYHPEAQKIPLALYTMATLQPGEDARRRAERFIKQNNYEPLAASLLASSLEQYSSGIGRGSQAPEMREYHTQLILDACRAWRDSAPDRSYVLPGGRIDPDRMLRNAESIHNN